MAVYSKKELATRLGVCVKTLERKIFAGEISYHKIGNRVLFDEIDVEKFWESCRRPAKKETA
jgi:excisionase family DNA binding protein